MCELCEKCYREMFFVTWEYRGMEIKLSKHLHKCDGCGQCKRTVRKVTANGKVTDLG